MNGNHTRLERKEDAIKDERLDSFIIFCVDKALSHIPNINVIIKNIDSTIGEINIRGNRYVIVHGDFDPLSKNGAANLTLMLGYKPYAIVYGHYHKSTLDDASGIKLIGSGCLGGTGDDYTVQRRLYGKPSQMVCVCGASGVRAYLPVEFN